MGSPVRPAPSEFDGGVLALVRIWHGMKGTGRRLHPFTPSSNCGILQLALQDAKRSPCVTPDVTTRQQLRLLRLVLLVDFETGKGAKMTIPIAKFRLFWQNLRNFEKNSKKFSNF